MQGKWKRRRRATIDGGHRESNHTPARVGTARIPTVKQKSASTPQAEAAAAAAARASSATTCRRSANCHHRILPNTHTHTHTHTQRYTTKQSNMARKGRWDAFELETYRMEEAATSCETDVTTGVVAKSTCVHFSLLSFLGYFFFCFVFC